MRWCRGDIRRQIEFFDPSVTIAPKALINPPFRGGACPKSVTHVSLLICHPCPPTIPYVARDAAGTPILAVRGGDGRVRAFHNACRHRGAQLADGSGCQKAFVCRYHGWTYGLDGRLRHVPHEDGFPGLHKTTRGLAPGEATEMRCLVF